MLNGRLIPLQSHKTNLRILIESHWGHLYTLIDQCHNWMISEQIHLQTARIWSDKPLNTHIVLTQTHTHTHCMDCLSLLFSELQQYTNRAECWRVTENFPIVFSYFSHTYTMSTHYKQELHHSEEVNVLPGSPSVTVRGANKLGQAEKLIWSCSNIPHHHWTWTESGITFVSMGWRL